MATPVDGATIARQWVSQGGPQKFLLNDGMNSEDFIKNVGAKYLENAYGTSSGTETTPSTDYFNANYKAFSNIDPGAPAAVQGYDAGAIVGLAIAQAGKADFRGDPGFDPQDPGTRRAPSSMPARTSLPRPCS